MIANSNPGGSTSGNSSSPRALRIAKFGAIASGILLTAINLPVLAGFALGAILPRAFPAPWTCLGLAAIGISLLAANASRSVKNLLLSRAAAASILLIGLISWAEYLSGRNFGFDTLLFPGALLSNLPHPGRPAPLSGLNFILMGLGLLLITSSRFFDVLIREISAVGVFTFSYLSLMGNVITIGRESSVREPMTPFTATLLLAGSAGLLASRPDGRLVSLLRNAGPAGVFARWLMPIPLVLPLGTALLRIGGEQIGLFDARTGTLVLTFADIFAAILIVWGSATQVLRADKLRRRAEDEVRESRDDLDRRVRLRTEELLQANQQLEQEIAERHKAEHALQMTNTTLSSVIEASPLGICAFNMDGTVREGNRASRSMRMAEAPEFRAFVDRAARGEHIAGAEVVRVPDHGPEQHLHVWALPLKTTDSRQDGILAMAVDVSERKTLEIQLRQTQKLESLGVLAGGIAHDFNNLLTGIMGNVSLAEEMLPANHTSRELIRQAVLATQRAADLTRQLLAYAGKGRFVLEQLNLSQLVREIAGLIQSSIPKNVQLRLDLDTELPSIDADASQIQQIIMNLVINGAEAICDSGTVTVSTGSEELDARYIRQYLAADGVDPGLYVTLEVSDTGSGMDEETKLRIFDPFFTTKFTGRGLGLAAVQGIVRGHKGALRVYSVAGHGTTFKLFFPASVQPHEIIRIKESVLWDLRGTGKILVIDDEAMVRQTARASLEWMGYTVETAESGEEGLRLFEASSNTITAVLLDLTMPGLSGQETFRRLKLINSDVPIVLSSGFNEVEVARHFVGKGLAGFIQKPYTASQLGARLKSVLPATQLTRASGSRGG
jgi:signal transduction histidine kinase/ActR/RegA family two-component response regulator